MWLVGVGEGSETGTERQVSFSVFLEPSEQRLKLREGTRRKLKEAWENQAGAGDACGLAATLCSPWHSVFSHERR